MKKFKVLIVSSLDPVVPCAIANSLANLDTGVVMSVVGLKDVSSLYFINENVPTAFFTLSKSNDFPARRIIRENEFNVIVLQGYDLPKKIMPENVKVLSFLPMEVSDNKTTVSCKVFVKDYKTGQYLFNFTVKVSYKRNFPEENIKGKVSKAVEKYVYPALVKWALFEYDIFYDDILESIKKELDYTCKGIEVTL